MCVIKFEEISGNPFDTVPPTMCGNGICSIVLATALACCLPPQLAQNFTTSSTLPAIVIIINLVPLFYYP